MARALNDILTELHATYNPQRDQYNAQINQVDPQAQAEEQGLNAAKQDAFSQIETAANRRGIFYGGMPIAEEQRYTGQSFLPSLANLRAKYAQQKFDLNSALNKVSEDERLHADRIQAHEQDLDEQKRQFDLKLAADREAAARAAAAGAGSASPTWNIPTSTKKTTNPANQGTLRQQWQREANGGDWNAQTLLNYVGNDNRYDGVVNSQSEYNILKQHGVVGNYFVLPAGLTRTGGGSGTGLTFSNGGGVNTSGMSY